MKQISDKTLAAHQRHHGTGQVSDMILKARLDQGWTEQDIQHNCKLDQRVFGEDDMEDQEAYRAEVRRTRKGIR